MIALILLVAAFVCAALAAANIPSSWPRPHLGWLAVALYFLSLLLARGLS